MATEINTDLKLRKTNVYANGSEITFADGTKILERDFIDYEPTEEDKYYTVKIGDELDEIAYNHYSEYIDVAQASKLWWVIALSNTQITNPLDLTDLIGVEIVIPEITRFLLING